MITRASRAEGNPSVPIDTRPRREIDMVYLYLFLLPEHSPSQDQNCQLSCSQMRASSIRAFQPLWTFSNLNITEDRHPSVLRLVCPRPSVGNPKDPHARDPVASPFTVIIFKAKTCDFEDLRGYTDQLIFAVSLPSAGCSKHRSKISSARSPKSFSGKFRGDGAHDRFRPSLHVPQGGRGSSTTNPHQKSPFHYQNTSIWMIPRHVVHHP